MQVGFCVVSLLLHRPCAVSRIPARQISVRGKCAHFWSSKASVSFPLGTVKSGSDNLLLGSSDPLSDETITILGYGSLLSEKSAKSTFPELSNFRLGRIRNYRRVFGHPASIFFATGIADLPSLQIASASAEFDQDSAGFVVSAFDVPNEGLSGVPSRALLEREASYDFEKVVFAGLTKNCNPSMEGWLSVRSTDSAYIKKWGQERFDRQFRKNGIETIWHWPEDSGLRPCAVYLRHCYLAAQSMGEECFNSLLDESYLCDRSTTIREYLNMYPEVLDSVPPPELALRYNG